MAAKMRLLVPIAKIQMKIDPYYEWQKCRTVTLVSCCLAIPRDHWSCCMLGLLAGSKGFQCQPQYYSSAAEMSRRNVNRAQTAHQPGVHGGHHELTGPHWGYSISRSFQRCVGGQETGGVAAADVRDNAQEFHKCCYAAAEERRQLRRARRYRRRHPARPTSRRQ